MCKEVDSLITYGTNTDTKAELVFSLVVISTLAEAEFYLINKLYLEMGKLSLSFGRKTQDVGDRQNDPAQL